MQTASLLSVMSENDLESKEKKAITFFIMISFSIKGACRCLGSQIFGIFTNWNANKILANLQGTDDIMDLINEADSEVESTLGGGGFFN